MSEDTEQPGPEPAAGITGSSTQSAPPSEAPGESPAVPGGGPDTAMFGEPVTASYPPPPAPPSYPPPAWTPPAGPEPGPPAAPTAVPFSYPPTPDPAGSGGSASVRVAGRPGDGGPGSRWRSWRRSSVGPSAPG